MRGKKPAQSRIHVDPIGVAARRSIDALAIEDRVVASVMRLIRERVGFGCSVDDVLRHLRASWSVLERRFREHLKRSPQAEIRAVQMSRVKQLQVERILPWNTSQKTAASVIPNT
jgi:LacI family transcriptional regulator